MAQATHTKKFRARTLLASLTFLATLGTTAHVAEAAPTTISDNAEITVGTAQTTLSRATRGTRTPATPAPTPAPAPEAAPAEAATPIVPARVRAASVGLDLPIHRGGQATIDQGVATWYDDGPGGFPDPTYAGDHGTVWLTGHRTQAGGPFGPVVNIPVGATVDIIGTDGTVVTYRIHSRTVVNAADTITSFFAVFGRDLSEKALTLQTSLPNNHRLIVRGEMV